MRRRIQRAAHRFGVEIGHFPPRYRHERRVQLLKKLRVDVVVDVGANEGQYAQTLRGNGYTGRIISLEPGSDAFARLTAAAAGDPLWDCRRLALMDKAGELTLNIAEGDDLNSFYSSSEIARVNLPIATTAQETVPTTTLDSIVAEIEPPAIWVKVDVQGAEEAVLAGGEQAMRRVVGIELELPLVPVYEGVAPAAALIGRLHDAGLRLVGVEPLFYDAELGLNLEFDGTFVREDALARLLGERGVS